MSIQAVAWALERTEIPARPKLVLVSVCNHANNVDGYCWLNAETIAREAACTPRSVYRFIGGLVRNGYLRKAPKRGADGKQRANDYWVLFNRPVADWDWGADPDAELEAEATHAESACAVDEPQDVVEPHDTVSPGQIAQPDDITVAREPVDLPAVSCGPGDNGVSRKRIAEPSKPNSKASSAGAHDGAAPVASPRAYRPPPVAPQGADLAQPTKQIFVYAPSKAYTAWAARKAKESGIRNWSLTTTANIDGQWRTGWYFPSLFPPPDKSPTDPPKHSAA